MNQRTGFTLVELCVVMLVSAIILGVMHQLLSRGIKSSMKGQDNLETIRQAAVLMNEIKRDLLAASALEVPAAASFTLPVGAGTVPILPDNANEVCFAVKGASVTYRLSDLGSGKKMVRRTELKGTVNKERDFGVPRMIKFRVGEITKMQQVYDQGDFGVKQLLVEIELDTKDPRFPTKNVKIMSFLISSQMSAGSWNYFF